ncbi:GNAT family N-acetyltransferase [Nocardioides marmorisolisilvae]|uniref:N-acetyltransferase n=1 Tax=Nocardioides marmorisolisilvae TaxID=1542737 RepID=A0A3N0DI39_9ACTN|nr:GNAT family protein [Nocardioides marmorisolisilvae]RNL75352.1 N-acetyltransferase [Nocardioides marmorisolisilvae]
MPTLADLTWPKQTARLSIRLAVEADLEPIWQYRRLDPVGMWMTDASKDLDAFVAKSTEVDRLASTLIVEADGRLVGDLMVRVESPWAQGEVQDQAKDTQAEIGWCLDPSVQGRGYGTESAAELIRIGFEDLGLRRLVAQCFADNEPSWRIMERLGMRREAYNVKDSLHRSGAWMDGMFYALLAEEWRAEVG